MIESALRGRDLFLLFLRDGDNDHEGFLPWRESSDGLLGLNRLPCGLRSSESPNALLHALETCVKSEGLLDRLTHATRR